MLGSGFSALFLFCKARKKEKERIMKELVLLGSTGSIGKQTLEVARLHNMKIRALAAKSNISLIEEQAREFKPQYVCIYDENQFTDLKQRLSDTSIKVVSGMDGLCQLAQLKCDIVVNSVVGMVGLQPTISAIEAKNTVALANKETLVAGGSLVMSLAQAKGVQIIPIDSEHSAIFQCLMGNQQNKVNKILLTASGGPFYGYNKEQLEAVTKSQALAHPNWVMGNKITIDSATMMNKGLELIEAVWLFDVNPDDVEIIVHRQSIIHSAVEYEDGSIIAQLGLPDMRTPIQFALTYPKRLNTPFKRLSLADIGTLSFGTADEENFQCLKCAKAAIKKGGNACCVMNSANEKAVELFLKDKIKFLDIGFLVRKAMDSIKNVDVLTLKSILETQRETEEFVLSQI